MGTRWAAADITVDSRLEGRDAGGSQWTSVALAAGELHGTVMPTPGLQTPADVACHSVITGPTVEAGLRQAFVHIFLTCQAFGRDMTKAQHPTLEPQSRSKACMPLGTGTSLPINQINSQFPKDFSWSSDVPRGWNPTYPFLYSVW